MRALLFLPIAVCLALVAPAALAAPVGLPLEETLPNGVQLVTQEWSGPEIAGQVLISIAFRGGVQEEPADQRGLTHWLGETLSSQARAQLESLGGRPAAITAELDLEYLAIQGAIEAEQFEQEWPMLINAMKDRKQTWTQYAPSAQFLSENLLPLMEDGPFMADLLLRSLIYANGPFVNPPLGTPPTLASLSEDDLRHWGTRLFQPDRCTVIVVYPRGVALDGLRAALADWSRARNAPELSGISVPQPQYHVETLRPMPTTVPLVTLGVIGPSVRDPGHAAYLVAATALGDAHDGRLAALLGESQRHAIRLSWEIDRHRDSSLTLLQLAQDADGDIFALHDATLAIIEETLLTGLSVTEISRAQGLLRAQLSGRQSDPVALLSWLTSWVIWEHPTAGRRLETRIAGLTPEEVNAALRQYFAIDKVAVAGLAPRLPDDYYFPSDDPFWGTFRRSRNLLN